MVYAVCKCACALVVNRALCDYGSGLLFLIVQKSVHFNNTKRTQYEMKLINK